MAFTFYGAPFQETSAKLSIFDFSSDLRIKVKRPATPRKKRPQAIILQGLDCFRFARHYSGNLN